jgi:hypothetical protein
LHLLVSADVRSFAGKGNGLQACMHSFGIAPYPTVTSDLRIAGDKP